MQQKFLFWAYSLRFNLCRSQSLPVTSAKCLRTTAMCSLSLSLRLRQTKVAVGRLCRCVTHRAFAYHFFASDQRFCVFGRFSLSPDRPSVGAPGGGKGKRERRERRDRERRHLLFCRPRKRERERDVGTTVSDGEKCVSRPYGFFGVKKEKFLRRNQ